jgi:hypothetical protein
MNRPDSAAKNMPKIAEGKLSSCRLQKKLGLLNCECGATFLKKLWNCDCESASFKLRKCDCGLKKKVARASVPSSDFFKRQNGLRKIGYS